MAGDVPELRTSGVVGDVHEANALSALLDLYAGSASAPCCAAVTCSTARVPLRCIEPLQDRLLRRAREP